MFDYRVVWPALNLPPINLYNMPMLDPNLLYEKLIYDNEAKNYRLYLTASEFKGVTYVNIRKYFQNYEGEYVPSKEGVSMINSIAGIANLLEGVLELVSEEEGKALLKEMYEKHCI